VAGSLASYCENYTVSNLIDTEIEELCLKWHKAIIDESENTIKESLKLSEIILKDSRIRVLAENPLLLTTLLFVKRWAGYLPTKRSVLYQEMIKLLLVTWNVEGHEILDIEEAEPQLAFVAYWMTKNGQQTISADDLNKCLIDARKQMPEILGYTNINPSEFIKRVESRSSLLILSGHKRLDSGHISAIYEFLHLSFQEYLTAKAIVKKFIPIPDTSSSAFEIIKPNISNENWKEVIPLSAVLLERDTKELIEHLIEESKILASKKRNELAREERLAPALLGSCLANEIQISPNLLETAIEWYAKNTYTVLDSGNTDIILSNKFGSTFRKKVKECFFEKYDDHFSSALGSTLADIFLTDLKAQSNRSFITGEIHSDLKNGDRETKCIAILGMMGFSFNIARDRRKKHEAIAHAEEIFAVLNDLLKNNDLHYQFSICWCVAWAGEANIFPNKHRVSFVETIIGYWTDSTEFNLQRAASWALCKILTPNIDKQNVVKAGKKLTRLKNIIQDRYRNPMNEYDRLTSIYLGKILGENFNQKDLDDFFNERIKRQGERLNTESSFSQFFKAFNIKIKEQSSFTIPPSL
jgi:hypothetical protein